MKFFYFFLILFLFSCSSAGKKYVCGDRPCIDKKEFNNYFKKNLIIEVVFDDKKKNKNIDLVSLNTNSSNLKKQSIKKTSRQERTLMKKIKKNKLKEEKIKLMEQRKIKKAEEKLNAKKIKNEKKKENKKNNFSIFKNKKKKIKHNKINPNQQLVKNNVSKINEKKNIEEELISNIETLNKNFTTKDPKSICYNVTDCDIEKIAEILIKKGKNKPFPNIASN